MSDLENIEMAFRIAGFGFKKKDLELFKNLLELVDELGGETTIENVVKVKTHIEDKYENIKND